MIVSTNIDDRALLNAAEIAKFMGSDIANTLTKAIYIGIHKMAEDVPHLKAEMLKQEIEAARQTELLKNLFNNKR